MPKQKKEAEHNCWSCVYNQKIPGDCHIGCRNIETLVTAVPRHRWPGCGAFPIAFDPSIIIAPCPIWSDDPKLRPTEEDNPMLTMIRIFTSIGRM